jgi:hypothetical protein
VPRAQFGDAAAAAHAAGARPAQFWQMQARSRAWVGTRASSSAPKLAWVHQQGPCGTPVSRSSSMAHRFACPHSGHSVAATGGAAIGTAAV